MLHPRSVLVAIAAVLLSACRYHPTPVQLQGDQSDISALAGNWEGEYSSDQTGRSGSIMFTITAGSDTAFGDVLMIPRMGQPLTSADMNSPAHATHASSPELLRITFVRVAGGSVQGALEPYVAPDCKCEVVTVFRGRRNGDVIEGTYITSGRDIVPQEGRWNVSRTK